MLSFRTPLNSINDGQVTDLNKIKNKINEELSRIKVSSKKVIFTLESTTIITREVVLPYAKDEELKRILSFEIDQYFPTDLEEYVVQSRRLEDLEEDGVKKSKILVAALPKLIVKAYLELANALDLDPVALDINSNGISKLFEINSNIKNRKSDHKLTIAIIDLGYDNINVNIIDRNIPQFSRLLTIGGKEIDLNISNNFNYSFDEAEKIKIEQCTYEEDTAPSSYFIIQEVVNDCINSWLEEIQRFFKFYTSRSPENRIDKIYLCGGHAGLKGINDYFESFFEISTEVIDKISCIDNKCNLPDGTSINTFLNAIGAIIRR